MASSAPAVGDSRGDGVPSVDLEPFERRDSCGRSCGGPLSAEAAAERSPSGAGPPPSAPLRSYTRTKALKFFWRRPWREERARGSTPPKHSSAMRSGSNGDT